MCNRNFFLIVCFFTCAYVDGFCVYIFVEFHYFKICMFICLSLFVRVYLFSTFLLYVCACILVRSDMCLFFVLKRLIPLICMSTFQCGCVYIYNIVCVYFYCLYVFFCHKRIEIAPSLRFGVVCEFYFNARFVPTSIFCTYLSEQRA